MQQQQQQLSQASLDAGEAKAGGAPPKYTGHWVLHCMEASTLCSDSSSSFHRPLWMQERQRHVEHVLTDRTLGVALYGS